jgi:hypothetical protein
MVNQKRDDNAPTVTFLSHTDGEYYTELVVIQGKISDDSASEGEIGEITSLSYEIIGSLGVISQAELEYDEDGIFTFQFATANIDGSAVVKIIVKDWNDNVGEYSITLKDPGNEIPSFTVNPGNKKVELIWNPVPDALSYTVHYTTNGTPPSVNYGKKVENITTVPTEASPLIIDELDNGNMHAFLLQAHSSNPGDLWLSDTEKAIPLSPLTLSPKVRGEFGKISIEWNSIPATDYFEVLRHTDREGDYINISGVVEATSLIDDTVDEGQVYYYKIKPSFTGSIESDANAAESSPFTFTEGMELVDIYQLLYNPSEAITVKGNKAYVADYSRYFYVIDILDPKNPSVDVLINIPSMGGTPFDIAVYGNYAYLATNSGLKIIDLNTFTVLPYNFFGFAWGIDMDEDYAYVVFYGSGPMGPGLYRFDLDNPNNYERCNDPNVNLPYFCDVSVDDTYIYVVERNQRRLYVIDKTSFLWDRTIPAAGTFDILPYKVSVSNNYASIIGLNAGLRVVDLSDDSIKTYYGLMYAMDVTAIGSFTYVADRYQGLLQINAFTDPPLLSSYSDIYGYAWRMAISDKYAYIATYNRTLSIVDISTSIPNNPFSEPPYPTSGTVDARNISVSGKNLYVATGSSGLLVLDISTPDTPGSPSTCDTPGIALDVAINGNYAFVADSDDPATTGEDEDEGALQVIDLSNLSSPVGSFNTPGDPEDVAVSGHHAYVADGLGGLQVIDVSFPDDPIRVGFRETPVDPQTPGSPSNAKGVAVSGNYAYVANGAGGLYIIDISIPENPIVLYVHKPATCDFKDVAIQGNYAYVADDTTGLMVLDITFPNLPLEVGTCDTPGTAESVALSGNYAFIADGDDAAPGMDGLQVIDVTSPSNPTRIGALNISGNAVGLAVTGSFSYVVNYGTDIKVIDLLPTN